MAWRTANLSALLLWQVAKTVDTEVDPWQTAFIMHLQVRSRAARHARRRRRPVGSMAQDYGAAASTPGRPDRALLAESARPPKLARAPDRAVHSSLGTPGRSHHSAGFQRTHLRPPSSG